MWIPYRGVNGEYGYLNTETGQFRTALPNSKEERQKEQQKQRKAALVTHSARQAKYNRTDAKRRNHSDETVKKQVSVPIMTMNSDGTFANNYVQQMAPNESSLSTHDPIAEFYIGTKALNPVFNLLGKGYTYGITRVIHPIQSAKTTYNMVSNIPRHVFNHLPYKTIDNVQRFISNTKNDAITFLKTPINESPIKAVRNRHKSLQVGKMPRTDIQYDNNIYYNTHSTSIQDIGDPISQIRRRLRTRMNNKNYVYSYPNDGIGIYLDNNMYNPDYIISQIPVKDYLSLKDVYKMGVGKHSGLMGKVINTIQTPINYLKVNTEPAFAYTGGDRFIKVNKKALKDFGFDYPTTLSHEYNHALRNRNLDDGKLWRYLGFNYDHLAPKYRNYLSQSTEIEARGTQLKNYFDSDVITPDMLKYASQHYVPDTGIDNNMYQFFSGIKDWNLAADYLSKFSLKNGGKL